MKIAIIRKKYSFHGGAETFSSQLIRRLAEEGCSVHIFAAKWDADESLRNICLHKIPSIKFNSALRDLTFAVFAYYTLKNKEFDIIQSHDKTLLQDIYRAGDGCHIEWLAQRWKRAGFSGKASIAINPYHWLILGLERAIFRRRRFKKIIAISQLVKSNIIARYQVNPADIEVIYNGVDLQKFHPGNRELYRARIRKKYAISEDEKVALFVGSGFERKGVRFILEALNLMEAPLTVLLVGKGRQLPFDDKRQNKRVIYCGPQKEIHMYYGAADFFLFPTMYEPFGNVHLEALASGLPVITTALSGAAEIIAPGEDGFVVPLPEDIAGIAAALGKLTDPKTLRVMSHKARQKAEGFSFEKHVKETLALYRSLLINRQQTKALKIRQ